MKLNPLKCVFNVDIGKLLQFIFSHCGINFVMNKIDAIVIMPPPRNFTELQSLQRKIQMIHRLISQLVDCTLPFTCFFKKDVHFIWDWDYQEAFKIIKTYLDNPPILMLKMQDTPFLHYLATSPYALADLLAQYDDDGKEREVYYISRLLVNYETCYSPMDKQCITLIIATQKLRHYLLHAKTHVIVKSDLVKHLFSSSNLSRRLAKWVMLPFEFDIKFVTQKQIKGQVLVD